MLSELSSVIICRIHQKPLEYTSFGKPNPFVFQNAEIVLRELLESLTQNLDVGMRASFCDCHFKTLYMVGDNPAVDINGARQVCGMINGFILILVG